MNNINPHKKLLQAAIVICIAGLFIVSGSASVFNGPTKTLPSSTMNGGDTIYVDDDNTAGPWDGTIYYPYQFIQDGVDHAADGDTVYVFAGEYLENVVIPYSIDLVGESKELTIVDGGHDFGTVINIYAEGVTVTGFTITHGGSNPNNAGIMVHTPYNIITENNIQQNNYFGIRVLQNDNTIYHNNFFDNKYQAFDEVAASAWDAGYPEGGNYWDDYTGTDDNEDGIGDISYPTGNGSSDRYPLIHPYGSVINENTSEIFLTIQRAINDADTLDTHVIDVKRGEYWEHVSIHKSLVVQTKQTETVIDGRNTGTVVSLCADEVTLEGFTIKNSGGDEQNAGLVINGDNCYITGDYIRENYHGIIVEQTAEDTVIFSNSIWINTWNGITLKAGCKGTIISENLISDNVYAGIQSSGASYNYLYHNNFWTNRYHALDDGANVWDDGYPSGGNYWDDYNGIDADMDGIGDTPYAIPGGVNQDRYPLMKPYTGYDTTPPIVTILTPLNGLYIRGHHYLSRLLQQRTIIIGDITISVDASDAQSQIEKVEFYIDDGMHPVSVVTQTPYTYTWTNSSLLHHRHTIIVVAYDNAGNYKVDMVEVKRFL